jgi:hypothetical protein
MCDYSLHSVASRPAEVGEKLISTRFENSLTRGFAAPNEPGVAVCLLPGTEIAFESDAESHPPFKLFGRHELRQKVARFLQVNLERPNVHHDALEFPDGQIVMVTELAEGQHVKVLQLPVSGTSNDKTLTKASQTTSTMV